MKITLDIRGKTQDAEFKRMSDDPGYHLYHRAQTLDPVAAVRVGHSGQKVYHVRLEAWELHEDNYRTPERFESAARHAVEADDGSKWLVQYSGDYMPRGRGNRTNAIGFASDLPATAY